MDERKRRLFKEPGDEIILETPTRGDYFAQVNLTRLTVEELDFVKRVIDSAFEDARPICQERDRNAVENFNSADDSLGVFERIYRGIPTFFKREGNVREHGKGLRT